MRFLKNLKFHQVLRTTGKRNYPERRNIKENSRLLEVSIDSLLDFDENVSVRLSSKKSVLKNLVLFRKDSTVLKPLWKPPMSKNLPLPNMWDAQYGGL